MTKKLDVHEPPAPKPAKPAIDHEPPRAPDRRGLAIVPALVPEGEALAKTVEAIEHVVQHKKLDKLGQVPGGFQVHLIRLHAVMTLGIWNGKRLGPDEQLALFQEARGALAPVLERFAHDGHAPRVDAIERALVEHTRHLEAVKLVAPAAPVAAAPQNPAVGVDAIRARLLESRYAAQATAADVANARAGKATSARIATAIREMTTVATEVAPLIHALPAGDRSVLTPVVQGFVDQANALQLRDATQGPSYWRLFHLLSDAVGKSLIPGARGAGVAAEERLPRIASELAAATQLLQDTSGIVAASKHLATARELLRGLPLAEAEAFKPDVEELLRRARELDRANVDRVDDRMQELMVRISDVAQLCGGNRSVDRRMAQVVNLEEDRARERAAPKLGEWKRVAKDADLNLEKLFAMRHQAIEMVARESAETDPPRTSFMEDLAVMAVSMAGGLILKQLLTAVGDKLVGGSLEKLKAGDAAANVFTPRRVVREVLAGVTDKAVEKGKAAMEPSLRGDRAGAAKDEDVKTGDSKSVKAQFFKLQQNTLTDQEIAARKTLNDTEGGLFPFFLEDPDHAIASLEAFGRAMAMHAKMAETAQAESTTAQYAAMLTRASLGDVQGNQDKARLRFEQYKAANPVSSQAAKHLVGEPSFDDKRTGSDFGHAMHGIGWAFDRNVNGLITIHFHPGDPAGKVKVDKAWAKGLQAALRGRLELMQLVPARIPFRATAILLDGGHLAFGRNEDGAIWTEVSGTGLSWCEAKAKTREGAKEKAARIVLEEEIGAWSLKNYHGVELGD